MSDKFILKVIPISHRNNNSLLLKFKYNDELITLSKSIGCKWSSTNKGWYVYHSNENIRLINNAFKDKADIDLSDVKPFLPKESKKPVSVKIPEEYLYLLIRRRYSENTIKVYGSLFKEFIQYYSNIKPEDITENDIRKYQDYLVKKRKISTSTQNQAINAIKFYYEKVLGREKGDFYIERPIREKKYLK